MKMTLAAALLLGAGLMPLSAFAEDPLPRATPEEVGMSSEALARIGAMLEADIEHGRIPGAVVAVARHGQLVYFEAFGWRDKEANIHMTTDTIFNIASMTKPMVAAGALMLYEKGELLIDDPVAKYLPQFADMKVAEFDASGDTILGAVPAARAITIQDLMRHTSGLIYGGRGTTAVHKLYPAGSAAGGDASHRARVPRQAGGGAAPLAARHRVGLWLRPRRARPHHRAHPGRDARGLSAQHLWKPLGMVDTGFVIPPEKAARYAKTLRDRSRHR